MSRFFITIFVILCGVALFITGIPLAKYLSSQYLELRSELNSQDVILKPSLRENSSPAAEKLVSQNGNQDDLLSFKGSESFELPSSQNTIVGPLQTPVKFKKRNKRQVPQQKEDRLSWYFNLIVTRYSTEALHENSNNALDAPPDKRLETVLFARATERKETALDELQNALKSVQIYLASFFANSKENDKHQELEINRNLRAHSENGSLEINTNVEAENIDAVDFGKESNKTSLLNQKGREGKFIFQLLGLGSRTETTTKLPEQESTQLPEQEATQSPEQDFSAPTENENSNAFRNNEELAKNSSFIEADITQNAQNIECSDCATQKLELHDFATETKETDNTVSETMQATEGFFTDEVLEKFCMSLVNKLEESQPEDDFDPELNPPDESNRLRSSQNPSILGLLTLFNSLKENEATPDSTVIEDSFLVSDQSEFQTPLVNKRQSRFLGLGSMLGFGSGGRSANLEDEPNDSISDKFNENIDVGSFPSISDCENYFRKKQSIKMFPKPNLMDMMSDPKIQLVDFANATISPKLKEQQLQFLTDLLKTSLNNSVDTFENMDDAVKKSQPEENRITPTKDLIDTSTNSNEEINQVTQAQRDARFFSLLGVGSGNDDSSRSSDSNSFLDFAGSGERFLEADTATKLERSGEFGSGEAVVFSEDLLELSTSIQESRFFGFVGFGGEGSGDGRELSESVETVSNEFTSCNESDCTDDCSDEILNTPMESYDCDDCDLENLPSYNISKLCVAKNESECNDCSEYDDKFAKSVPNTESIDFGRNITAESFRRNFEDCNCFQNHSITNASFLECECNSNGLELPGDSSEIGGSYLDEALEFENATISAKGHGNECDDCNYDGDVPNTNATDSNRETYFFECDDCNSNVINESDGGYQSEVTKSVNETSSHGHGIDCDDCAYETHSSNTTDFENEMLFSECEECRTNISVESHETTNETFSHKGTDLECDDCNSYVIGIQEESLSGIDGDTAGTEEDNHQTTEKIPRFLRPIFLTGSGDGNVFGNSGGPINLVKEESTIMTPVFPSRRARLDDIEDKRLPTVLKEADWEERERTPSSEIFPVNIQNSANDSPTTAATIIAPVFPRRRGRLDDIEEVPCEDCNIDISEFGSNPKGFEKNNPVEDASRPPKLLEKADLEDGSMFSPETFPISVQDSTDASTTTELQPRYCTSASQCNSILNERCITIKSSSVCGCDRAYVRHKETNKCVVKRVVEASLKLPGEKFDEDLKNPLSPRYKQMKKDSLETMWLYLKNRPDLLSIIAEVELAGFSEGSLIVIWNLVFAAESDSEAKLIGSVEDDFKEALKDGNLLQKAALDMNNASVLAFSETNHCSSRELNYCSENAYCVVNRNVPARFVCFCKEHYRDASSNPRYVGETCIAKCPPDYCGPNGHCEILANDERHCMCNGLYFGRRCEVPGLYVLVILAVVASISITIVIVLVFRKRCTTVSYGGSQAFRRSEETGMHMHTNDRVSDAIALEENIGSKVTKYANISTPLSEVPVIRVTRPTLRASSISFEGDSTFEATPRKTPSNTSQMAQST